MRTTFIVHYKSGATRGGTIYIQSNIKMDDGELFARLDQLITKEVTHIEIVEIA